MKAIQEVVRPLRAWSLCTWLLLGACSDPEPRHVILVTIDTHRGDHVLEERAGEALTPALERFARRAVVYREAMSVSHSTTPGTAGILTGLLPYRSGVVANHHTVTPELSTLAEELSAAGLRTGGFVSNPNLREGTGFESGFEVYERVRGERRGEGKRIKARGEDVAQAALAWLDGLDLERERVFLWVHFMEPHGPYEPPERLRALFPKEFFQGPRDVELLQDNEGRGGIPPYQQVSAAPEDVRDSRDYLARYAAEVRALDEALDSFLGALERRGMLEQAIVAITADHGEALAGERGFFFSHAHGASRDQVHVPLLLAYPGCAAGTEVERPVSTLDLAPTIYALLGLSGPAELDGRSLVRGGSPFALSQTPRELSIREGGLRLIVREGGRQLLIDDETDPASALDLSAEHPERVAELARKLEEARGRAALGRPVER